jgi:hypothetical protein
MVFFLKINKKKTWDKLKLFLKIQQKKKQKGKYQWLLLVMTAFVFVGKN